MIITVGSILPDDKGNEYKVLSVINSGGFGQVFMCERASDKKKFALKTMLNAFPTSEEYNAFQNELESAKNIHCDNTIKYEFMHDGKMFEKYQPFIIMEFANQGSLKELIEQKRESKTYFTNDELNNMFLQLSLGMDHINSILVHRDIKPENILIIDNVLKITDFGLAKYSEAKTRSVTFKGYGTEPYCAPEVWKNEKNTIEMDIYSMGIVFYELATLNYPYKVNSGNYMDAHLYEPVETPLHFNSSIAPNLVSIINKMLQKPKSKRFSNWKEIIEALKKGMSIPTSDNKILSLVQSAVEMQNAVDSAKQKKQAEEERKKKAWENNVKKIMSYFNNEVLNSIRKYVEIYNSSYASENIIFHDTNFNIASKNNTVIVQVPNNQSIAINLTVIDPEPYKNPKRYTKSIFGTLIPTAAYQYPMCKGKKVLAWGKIEDKYMHGYNILLLENEVDEYGDWYILYNKNSGINTKPRPEPFAFSESELPEEIWLITAVHIYTSTLEKYNINRFHELITMEQLQEM